MEGVISFYGQGDEAYREWLNDTRGPEGPRKRPRNVSRLLGITYTAARRLSRFSDSAPLEGVSPEEPEALAQELERVAKLLKNLEFEED